MLIPLEGCLSAGYMRRVEMNGETDSEENRRSAVNDVARLRSYAVTIYFHSSFKLSNVVKVY